MLIKAMRVLALGLCFTVPLSGQTQGQTVAGILEDVRLHGYDAPSAQITALERATDRPGNNAPLDARRKYYVALGEFAGDADDSVVLERAAAALERMGKAEGCKTCAAQALILRAGWTLTREGAGKSLEMLMRAGSEMGEAAPDDARMHLFATRARNYRLSGDHAKSIVDAVKASRIADAHKDAAMQVEMGIMLALDNASLGDFSRAEKYVNDAIEQANRIGYGYQLAYAYLNLGHINALRSNREGQRSALTKALELSAKQPDLSEVRMIALSNLADYHLGRNEYKTALDYSTEAVALARSLDVQRTLGIALTNEGLALAGLGQTETGIVRVKQAIEIARRMGNREHVIGMTHELIGIYERNGRYKEAVASLHKVAEFEKALTAQERQRDVLALQEEFATQRKQQEIDRLSAINAQQQAVVKARNAQRWMWLSVAVALAMAAFFSLRSLRGARSDNQALSIANEVLEEQTSRDPLTGTYNRRHFQNLLQQASKGRSDDELRKPQPYLSLAVLDLDHFKQINDTYGHEAGDAVLIEVADRLRHIVRAEDAVVRWGGEEFVLVLPATGAEGSHTLVSRVLDRVGSSPVHYKSRSIPITVSAGCATIPEDGAHSWRQAVQIADLALYRAKAAGRNRAVCVSGLEGQDLGTARQEISLDALEASGGAHVHLVAGPDIQAA